MPEIEPSDDELLDLFLAATEVQRLELFADTARAAQISGLSRRTIQVWIDSGAIRAIPIGKKYQVYLTSLVKYLSQKVKAAALGSEI
jgi:excisionase family DNA binding protein